MLTTTNEGVYVPHKEYASKGVAGSALGLSIAGTALGLMNGNGNGWLGGLFGNNNNNAMALGVTSAAISSKDAEIGQLKAEKYADQVGIGVYQQLFQNVVSLGTRLATAECEIKALNQKIDYEINGVTKDYTAAIALESERRKCGDENLYAYVNATFVPGQLKMPASAICPPITATSTTTTTTTPSTAA